MPRAVKLELGDDGYEGDPVGDWKLTASDVAPLLGYLGEGPKLDAASLAHLISRIGEEYRRRAHRGPDAFSRAEARKALDHVLKQPTVTAHAVIFLNERAFSAVHDQLMMTKGIWAEGDSPIDLLYSERISGETLQSACQNARSSLAAVRGRETDSALHICADELCGLYEKLSGRRVKLSNKMLHREYSDAPRTSSGLFVCDAIKLIIGRDRELSDRCIPSAVSGYVRQWIRDRSLRKAVPNPRTEAGQYRLIGCSLDEGEHQCNVEVTASRHAAPASTGAAHDQDHSRPAGRNHRDRVAEAGSEKCPNP